MKSQGAIGPKNEVRKAASKSVALTMASPVGPSTCDYMALPPDGCLLGGLYRDFLTFSFGSFCSLFCSSATDDS